MASTVEAQTAEEEPKVCPRQSHVTGSAADATSRNLAVNKNIKQFQRLMRSHAWCSKYRCRSSRSGPGFERVLADQRQAETLTSDFKAFPQMVYVRTDLRSRAYISKLVRDVKHDHTCIYSVPLVQEWIFSYKDLHVLKATGGGVSEYNW